MEQKRKRKKSNPGVTPRHTYTAKEMFCLARILGHKIVLKIPDFQHYFF